ncbi:hypothetical protein CDEST_15604 [Colletotrichum destructivum]|uniref:Rhodopsin domain-containing protein n=1 Tax=Colletotrichum destructivum TaxID=34406 RepID=A0AAX4J5D9_9PEZI|nr:hypothetical protein CDEST_15604 [Colletotrichum destructivum]
MGINSRDFLTGEWILLALCFVIISARLAVRTWKKIWSFWLSDVFLLISLLFFLILVVGDTYTLSIGKSAFVEEYYDEGFAKWKFASSVVFDLGFYFPRFSLLAFYNELFSESEKRLRLCLYLVTAYATCAFIATLFMDIFWCGTDVSRNWSDANATCTLVNSSEPMYVAWSIGIISELFDLVGSTEIATQITVIALPALRPLLGFFSVGWSRCSRNRSQSRNKRPLHGTQQQNQQAYGTSGSVKGSEGALISVNKPLDGCNTRTGLV